MVLRANRKKKGLKPLGKKSPLKFTLKRQNSGRMENDFKPKSKLVHLRPYLKFYSQGVT